jgi:hypothetical protein
MWQGRERRKSHVCFLSMFLQPVFRVANDEVLKAEVWKEQQVLGCLCWEGRQGNSTHAGCRHAGCMPGTSSGEGIWLGVLDVTNACLGVLLVAASSSYLGRRCGARRSLPMPSPQTSMLV